MLPMRFELIISSLQDWCLTIMALEAGAHKGNRTPGLTLARLYVTITPCALKNIYIYDRRESNPGIMLGRHIVYH